MSKQASWKTKLSKVESKLIDAEKRMAGWEDNLEINNKNLELACVEHASWLAYYEEIAIELKYVLEFVEMIEKEVRGIQFKFCKDSFQKEYTDSSILKVIDANADYLEVHEMYLIVQEIYDKARVIVKGFEQRSYSLNNIVKIREKELEHVVIRT